MKIRRLPLGSTATGYDLAQLKAKSDNILEKIVWHKQSEILALEQANSIAEILADIQIAPVSRDFYQALSESSLHPALIAEVKKASPSKGVIRADFDPVAIAQAYARAGATCLSVLTDVEFFQGSFSNLLKIRQVVDLPLLCKEFIISTYQIYNARSHGADAVLLITAILNDSDLMEFSKLIYQLGMTVLIEVHSQVELARVIALKHHFKLSQTLIGINNRNLETFTVDLEVTKTLIAALLPHQRNEWVWVSESGIHTPEDLAFVVQSGVGAVLVGESLLKQADLAEAIGRLYIT
jgi:indole-3-glycerol phosphate synthase